MGPDVESPARIRPCSHVNGNNEYPLLETHPLYSARHLAKV